MRYRLRTLLVVLALAPPMLAAVVLVAVRIVREPGLILGIAEVLSALACIVVPLALAVLFLIAVRKA